MRTTIDIPDDLYKKLKSKAALEGTSVRNLMTQAAQSLLESEKLPPIRKFRVPVIHSSRPGTLNMTNEEIDELISFT
jgi:hypothetical protein